MNLLGDLQETTTIDKVRRLLTSFTSKPFEDIREEFSLTSDINVDRDYFLQNMATALNEHFKVGATAESIREIATLRELTSFLDSFCLMRTVFRTKTAIAALQK